jgi:long-chain fatty acid transport protein
MSSWNQIHLSLISVVACCLFARDLNAQTFGIELHNNLMPASGGMGGASISRPQDLQSAIAGNPATLRQFQGTQFSFGGAWADVNYNVTQTASLPLLGVTPYSGTSVTPGALLGNIGLTQDLDDFGLPATMGMGLISNAGAGVNFRNIPESNGTSAQYMSLDLVSGISTNLTDRLSIGASAAIATSYLDGPFVDFAGMTPAYGFRGTVGANYLINPQTTFGVYWQSKKNLLFGDAALLPGNISRDVAFDHPSNTGIGIARDGLMNGRLLLAADVVFKDHSQADLLSAIFKDQWCFQFGSQYAYNQKIRLRSGYVFAENPMKDAQLQSIGGINLPDGVPGVRYIQGQFAAITEHRITGGVGIRDFQPGIDLDLFAGYGFDASDQFAATSVRLDGNYWLGFGTTWRFGGCSNRCDIESNTQTVQ